MTENFYKELMAIDSYTDLLKVEKGMRVQIFKEILNNPQQQKEIAQKIGISTPSMSRFLRQKEVSLLNLTRVCRYLCKTFESSKNKQ